MRIPLATDIKTRTGAPDKDARIKNAYVETRGDQSVVRKRPIAQGGISVATVGSIAQGGIAYTTSSGGNGVFFLNGDTQSTYTGDGTTWSAATNYSVGDHVTVDWKDYWALADNINQSPTTNPEDWSTEYVPDVPVQYANTQLFLSYNGEQNFTFGNLTPTSIGAATLSSTHSAPTLSEFIALITTDAETTNPTTTGTYSGDVGGEAVSGSWSCVFDLTGTYWDENPFFEIEASLQNILSTNCTRPDLIPNGTIIGNMGNQGQNRAWEGRFSSHP